MVQGKPSHASCGAVGEAEPEAARALRVLWDHGQHPQPEKLLFAGQAVVAEVVEPEIKGKTHAVGSLQPIAGALSAAGTEDSTPILVAKPCFEEPYALIALVRLCGGVGRVTSRLYPERKYSSYFIAHS